MKGFPASHASGSYFPDGFIPLDLPKQGLDISISRELALVV